MEGGEFLVTSGVLVQLLDPGGDSGVKHVSAPLRVIWGAVQTPFPQTSLCNCFGVRPDIRLLSQSSPGDSRGPQG